ncbi:MAG: NADH-quinone oxidoreductase subunit H [Holophagaceae bacterium]|nr:NADH-quinone oxidoreductase subunit H [Holophagaceae bacterium]
MTLTQLVVMALLQIVLLLAFVMMLVPLITFAERKVIAYVQVRLGATRTAGGLWGAQAGRTHKSRTLTGGLNGLMWYLGRVPMLSIFRGLPVFIADAVKLLTKEDIVPEGADKAVFILSPAISVISAFTVFSAVAFAPGALFTFPAWFPIVGGLPFNAFLTDINVGLLFILGISSVGVYGIVLGAWASNSKYPLLGGLRSAAQIISYEVPLTLSLLVPVILTGSLNFNEMARRTATEVHWLAIPLLFVGFFIYTTCAFAETNRVPFDLAEAETELVSGFHTEYTGMKFSFYFLAEYANMILVSALAAGFFLGGHYLLPFGFQTFLMKAGETAWFNQPSILFFLGKVLFLLFVFIWVRATLPRYRYDQLMHVGWKYLIPYTLVLIFVAALIRYIA